MTARRVLFEPWSLGDVIIAASVLPHLSHDVALACNSRWHPLVRSALELPLDSSRLMPADLPYTTRQRVGRFDTKGIAPHPFDVQEVLSIRGDPRDFMAARRLFPGARIRMAGWFPFLARRFRLLDFPFASGWLPVRNRYRAWAELAGIPFNTVEKTFLIQRGRAPRSRSIVIHIGAQWQSRQYPWVAELRDTLSRHSYQVKLLSGPNDPLPPEIAAKDVATTIDESLITVLKKAEFVFTNDSSPMHLAALLGCRCVAVGRISNLEEWIPPGVRRVTSPLSPKGYRPANSYLSDCRVEGWPKPEEVITAIEDFK